jgi:hypothetical protein
MPSGNWDYTVVNCCSKIERLDINKQQYAVGRIILKRGLDEQNVPGLNWLSTG